MRIRSLFLAAAVTPFMAVAVTPADAGEACFTAFNGTVHYQFETSAAALKAVGVRGLDGRVFGALSSCAGLTQWPTTGTVIASKTLIEIAFRSFTVDATTCGAADNIVQLDPKTLKGTLQLNNVRTNFGNQSAIVPAACANPTTSAPNGKAGPDALGN